MSTAYFSLLANIEVLRTLEPEELAGHLMTHLNTLPEPARRKMFRGNAVGQAGLLDVPRDACSEEDSKRIYDHLEEIGKYLMEAWMWLEREGFLAPMPNEPGAWYFITRRGARVDTPTSVEAFRKADLLPRRLLHARIAPRVWSAFLRGEYDTAVFQAFKEVEVAVREAGKYGLELYGPDLMRKAFRPNDGPLTDRSARPAEQEALMHLFAGAIGSYKNPHSHRHVPLGAEEAVEMIVLASHLLRIVDARS